MGTALVESIFANLVIWVTASLLVYPITRVVAPKFAAAATAFVIVGLPLMLFLFVIFASENNRRKYESRVQKEDAEKFGTYTSVCNKSEMKVYEKVTSNHSRGVALLDITFFKGQRDVEHLGICLFGGEVGSTCVGSKIDFFERQPSAKHLWYKYSKAAEQSAFSSERFVAYKEERPEFSTAKYGLILGSSDDPQTGASNAGYEVSKSTFRVVRIADNKLLGQSSIYFLNSSTGKYGCPDANHEISKLLSAIFK